MKDSPLCTVRKEYRPKLPTIFEALDQVTFASVKKLPVKEAITPLFPHTSQLSLIEAKKSARQTYEPLRIGVVFSGGQAPGGHNVVCGLFDALKALNPNSELYGFLGGPSGVVKGNAIPLQEEKLTSYRNQGGFDLLGSGRTKIETKEQMASALESVKKWRLNGFVIVGGDDSNTNAAILAEYFLSHGETCAVVGVPKTIDGDLRNPYVDISFGFDTACRTYSEMIGNIARDALSAKKYTHFIKLMGRSASHVTLECALQTHPNLVLIGEEVEKKGQSLEEITRQIADWVVERAARHDCYGVILIPEGLIEFIPEVKALISALNKMSTDAAPEKLLLEKERKVFAFLPLEIQKQLLLDRDPHGNVQVSKIATDQLLIHTVRQELKRRGFQGDFNPQAHFLGYEGRSALPTNFDATYCQALGMTAALLIAQGHTGMMACLEGVRRPLSEWRPIGLPLATLLDLEERKGAQKPVIPKALVDLNGQLFKRFSEERKKWALEDDYRYPGPIQFFGPEALTHPLPLSLQCLP